MDRRFFIYLFNKSFVKLRKENFVFTQCRQCLYPSFIYIRFLNVFVLLYPIMYHVSHFLTGDMDRQFLCKHEKAPASD